MTESRRITWNGLDVCDPGSQLPTPVWAIPKVTGILGDASAVAVTGQRVQADGQWRTIAYRSALAGGLTGRVRAATAEECDTQIRLLRAAASINVSPLTVHEASGPKTLFVWRDGELSVTRITPYTFEWAATVVASDPVWWWGGQTDAGELDDSFARVLSTGLPNRIGGLSFPLSFPIDFAATGDTGDLTFLLQGAARMTWRVDGPVANPTVTVANSRGVKTIAWQLSLVAGEYLAVDPHVRSSLLQGQASRTPWMRQWHDLVPGENSIRFRADGYDAAARLTVTIQPLA